jgi:uncharacterized protein (DUF362 family)
MTSPRRTTRRELLRTGARAVLAAGAARALGGCFTPRAPRPVPGRSPTYAMCPLAPPVPARVHVARGKDLVAITRAALDSLGGAAAVIRPGDRVFLKPNLVTLPWAGPQFDPFRGGECTKAEVIVAVAEQCLEAGAAEVVVGDGSQRPRFDWALARYLDGSSDLAAEAARLARRYGRPVRLACLEVDTPEWIEVPTRNSYGTVAVSSLVLHADKVVSIPVAKTHSWAYFTLSLKNFIGVTPLARYGAGSMGRVDRWKLHRHDMTPLEFNRFPQDIARAVKPALAVIDLSVGMEGDGPSRATGGEPLDVSTRLGDWLVLASTDLAAADATAARIMSQDESHIQEVFGMARADGLGAMCAEEIALVGGELAALRIPWKPARLQNYG